MAHTPTLKYDAERGWLFISGGTYSETLLSFPHVEAGDKAFWLTSHHAQRICATWNALSGISTEAIEAGAVKGLVDAAKAMLPIATKCEQLDRLAAALSQLADTSNA